MFRIYQVCFTTEAGVKMVYIGSTQQSLKTRLGMHKASYRRYLNTGNQYCTIYDLYDMAYLEGREEEITISDITTFHDAEINTKSLRLFEGRITLLFRRLGGCTVVNKRIERGLTLVGMSPAEHQYQYRRFINQ